MKIAADISMYPLNESYKPAIKAFIRRLRQCPGLNVITNQLSTQLTGDFEAVTSGITACMHESMENKGKVVFIIRYLNADLDINVLPEIG